MVSFELGKEIEKDVLYRLVTIVGQEKILIPHEETNLRHSETPWGLRIFSLSHAREKTEETYLSIRQR